VSNDKNESSSEIKLLQKELAETKQLVNQLLADKQQAPVTATVVMPDVERERNERLQRRLDAFEAEQAKAHAELMRGPRHFRICIFDAINLNEWDNLRNKLKNPGLSATECSLPPQNPWRTVGAHDETLAQVKYNKFFGIKSIAGESQYICYEVDEHGQPLVAEAAAA